MTAAIVLAAGASRRLGRPKQLVRIEGVSLVRRAAMSAIDAGCGPVIVVQGCVDLRDELRDLPVRVVVNEDWQAGPGGSIRAGAKEVIANGRAASVVVLVCDQARLSADVIQRLISLREATKMPIAACGYAGIIGTPCVFDASIFSELGELPLSQGAKRVLSRDVSRVAVFDWADGAIDIDVPADLERLDG